MHELIDRLAREHVIRELLAEEFIAIKRQAARGRGPARRARELE